MRKPAASFEQVRAKLQEQQLSVPYNLPAEATKVTAAERRNLESTLRKRLESTRAQSGAEFFRVDNQNNRASLDNLTRRVDSLPKAEAFDPIRNRLANIEAQFDSTNRQVSKIQTLDNPRELLKLQMEMYQMTQQIELVGKAVEQVNTGVKSILQTQV
ncbi:MAG: hypothetical protein ACRD8O_20340 [Bryobacteraceae bacterium]